MRRDVLDYALGAYFKDDGYVYSREIVDEATGVTRLQVKNTAIPLYIRDYLNPVIGEFQGMFRWLSNFWICKVVYKGHVFHSVENAYQFAKTSLPGQELKYLELFQRLRPGEAKKIAGPRGELKARDDWEEVKVPIMEELVASKFNPDNNPSLVERLLDTGKRMLIEGNRHGDTFWGQYFGRGKNYLGRILMHRRLALAEPNWDEIGWETIREWETANV